MHHLVDITQMCSFMIYICHWEPKVKY